MDSKTDLRKTLLASVDVAVLRHASEAVVSRLKEFLSQHDFKRVASYAALPNEISLEDLSGHLPDIDLCYPRVEGAALKFYQIKNNTELMPGAFNISEPDPRISQLVETQDLAATLVPGVAFDRQGHRLGRGKGFYDRFFQDYTGVKIGVCGSWQMTDQLPIEPHDVAMDYVVTEKFILRPIRTTTKGINSSWNRNP